MEKNGYLEILKSVELLAQKDINSVRRFIVLMWAERSPVIKSVLDGEMLLEKTVEPLIEESLKLHTLGPKVCDSEEFSFKERKTVHLNNIFKFRKKGVDLTSRVSRSWLFLKGMKSLLWVSPILLAVWLSHGYWITSFTRNLALCMVLLITFSYYVARVEKYVRIRRKCAFKMREDAKFLDKVIASVRV